MFRNTSMIRVTYFIDLNHKPCKKTIIILNTVKTGIQMADQSVNIYKSFFDNSVEGMIIFDTDGTIVNINGPAKQLFKIDRNAPAPQNIKELINPKYYDELWRLCDARHNEPTSENQNSCLVISDEPAKGNKSVVCLYLNNHILTESGSLFSAVVIDETEQWKNKEELRRYHAWLEKSFVSNPVAQVIVRSEDKTITNANDRFLSLFGYKPGEVIGLPVETVLRQYGADEQTPATHNRGEKQAEHEFELSTRTKDGSPIAVLKSYVYIEVHDIPYELWTLIDITDQKRAEDELKRNNEELELKVTKRTRDLAHLLEREQRMNELKSRFVATASHEFRTPLTTILASTGLLENYIELQDSEKCAKHISRIKSSVRLLTDILEDFLSLDKIEHGQVKPNITVFGLREFAEQSISEAEGFLKKGQHITYALNEDVRIKQDAGILKNTVLNLLSNASKYSDANGTIHWNLSVQPEKITLTISDNGIGIPADDQPYIFSRFFRARNAEVIQGTGLGLNIVKKYVELLHGKISFASTENEGTTFILEFPLPH